MALRQEIEQRQRAQDALESVEAQLRQAQKMEAVGRLAGGIAHDFNNLLSVILNCARFAELSVLDPEVREDVHQIRMAGTRAAMVWWAKGLDASVRMRGGAWGAFAISAFAARPVA